MSGFSKEDLAKMNKPYIESLDHETLVDVTYELRNIVIEQLEILERNSSNSSKPPSSDDPYKKDQDDNS